MNIGQINPTLPTAGQNPWDLTTPMTQLIDQGNKSAQYATIDTRVIVTDPAYGGKGDGIVLNDLTVTSGSATITSNTAPFTSTAVDAGKTVIWLTGATTMTGTIASVQSSTQATLTANASASSVAFGGPNTNGAFGTDNTAAFNAALTAAQAAATNAGSNRSLQVVVPQVHIPAGVFLTTSLNAITAQNGIITGDGYYSTFIVAAITSGTLFSHGTFSTTPAAGGYVNVGSGWRYRDLNFMDPCRRSSGTEGQRTVTAIQDNGGGGIRINNCRFTGFAYGFAGAYASDFSDITDSYFEVCDVCAYFGPGSQQVNIAKSDFTTSREGLVFEGAPQWHVGSGSSFEDNTVASVTIEAKASGVNTRFGLASNYGGAYYAGVFLIDGGCWFETNSGGNGRTAARLVYVNGDGPFGIGVSGVIIRDAYLVGGGTQVNGGTNCFVELNSAYSVDEPVIIDNLIMSDPNYCNFVYKFSGSASDSKPLLKGVRRNTSKVSLTTGNASSARWIEVTGAYHGFTSS